MVSQTQSVVQTWRKKRPFSTLIAQTACRRLSHDTL